MLRGYQILTKFKNRKSLRILTPQVNEVVYSSIGERVQFMSELECGPMPNMMAAQPNIGDALCSTPQSLADAHY